MPVTIKDHFIRFGNNLFDFATPFFRGNRILYFFIPIIVTIVLFSCKGGTSEVYEPKFSQDSLNRRQIIFCVQSVTYYESADLFVRYINERLDSFYLKLEASGGYDDYQKKLERSAFDLSIINGYYAFQAEKIGYKVFAKVKNDEEYRGVIISRKDALINSVKDIKGKMVSFPGKGSVAGTMMPLYFLQQNGIDVNKEIQIENLNSFESCMLNVYVGKSIVAGGPYVSWLNYNKINPDIASSLTVRWMTPPLVNFAVIIKNTHLGLQQKLSQILLEMQNNDEGKRALEKINYSGFEQATIEKYAPVEKFINTFNTTVKFSQ